MITKSAAFSDKSPLQDNTAIPRSQLLVIGAGILLTMLPVTLVVTVLKELISVRFSVSLFWAHAFMSASLFGAILFAPVSALIIDYLRNRRLVIVLSLLLNALCFLIMWGTGSFRLLMLVRFIEGAAHITALSAWMASGASLGGRARAGRVMGTLGGLLILGITIGVPLGGFIARGEASDVLWSAAAFSFAAALAGLAVSNRYSPQEKNSFQDYLITLRQMPWLLLPYLYTFIDRLSIGVVISSLTLYMSEILHFNPAQRGLELFGFLLPFALLSYPAGRLSDRYGRIIPMASGSVLFGLVYMSYGFLGGNAFTLVMIVSGVLCALMFAPNLAMCRDLSPQEYKGSAFAGYNMAGSLGFAVGPLLGGGLYNWLSTFSSQLQAFRSTFIITGSFEVLCALLSLPLLIKLYRSGKVK